MLYGGLVIGSFRIDDIKQRIILVFIIEYQVVIPVRPCMVDIEGDIVVNDRLKFMSDRLFESYISDGEVNDGGRLGNRRLCLYDIKTGGESRNAIGIA